MQKSVDFAGERDEVHITLTENSVHMSLPPAKPGDTVPDWVLRATALTHLYASDDPEAQAILIAYARSVGLRIGGKMQ